MQERGATFLGLVLAAALWAGGGVVAGCGSGTADMGPVATIPEVTTQSGADVGTSGVFVEVAASLAPMPVYGPLELPAGTTLSEKWWPVVDLADPAAYAGPETENPRISAGEAGDGEVQAVFACGEGWLVVLANYRGDLGDVRGARVGTVEGHNADLYEVNGGVLVQWSDAGRWYGVFGRGVARQTVVDVALSMRVVSADDGR
jgi:hypothetical protein